MTHWLLFDLVVGTPRIELRPVREADMWELMDLADRGVHDPATMPFQIPWTDEPAPQRHWHSARFYWNCWATWSPTEWRLPMVVRLADGTVVGAQDAVGVDFPARREADTGSWLGRAFQGLGLGTEMRQAIAHLAFVGLGAQAITSGAFWDNPASIGVSTRLGYDIVGEVLIDRRGVPDRSLRFRLDRDRWAASRRDDIVIDGLDGALGLFGL